MSKISLIEKITDIAEKILYKNKGFEFYYNRGIDYFNKKKYEKALLEFKTALECQHPQPQVYYNMGLTHHYLGNYEKAVTSYNKFLESKPEDYDGLYNLALAYYNIENYSKAKELFEKCLSIKKDEEGVKALVLAYLSLGESENAVELAQKLSNEGFQGKNLAYAIAKTFENKNSFSRETKNIDTAIDLYQSIILTDSENHNLYLSISICYAKKGDWEKSVEYCKKALEKAPASYEVNNQMGLIYYCRNEVEEAVKFYEIALKAKPEGDYKIYSNLAYAYEKLGEKDKAIKMFNSLLKKFPNYPAKDEIKNHLRILKNSD
ncbi:MAG TPA: tetratricopeptide repeat protein [Candidatus Gastranaerophilaceae bacterium]|nr:tetratricopeptide repeat protein [Candidatus Gastranaerophilaceae bacterium]